MLVQRFGCQCLHRLYIDMCLVQSSGKERYVFFSFPHIGIDSKGVVGNISRPGRAGMSCACGAVIKVCLSCQVLIFCWWAHRRRTSPCVTGFPGCL